MPFSSRIRSATVSRCAIARASGAIAIRPYRADDVGALFEAARESIREVSVWLPWCHEDYSIEEAQEWVGTQARLLDEGTEYNFVIAGGFDRFLGGCSLNQISRNHRFANLGYWVRTSATGRGVATTAVRQLTTFAFTKTELIRLEIVCAVGNKASQRVAEKAGAVREGVLHDRLLIRDEPRSAVMYLLTRSR